MKVGPLAGSTVTSSAVAKFVPCYCCGALMRLCEGCQSSRRGAFDRGRSDTLDCR